jgi:hypothetical protein
MKNQPVTEYVRYNLMTDDRLRCRRTWLAAAQDDTIVVRSPRCGSFGKRIRPIAARSCEKNGHLKAFDELPV